MEEGSRDEGKSEKNISSPRLMSALYHKDSVGARRMKGDTDKVPHDSFVEVTSKEKEAGDEGVPERKLVSSPDGYVNDAFLILH